MFVNMSSLCVFCENTVIIVGSGGTYRPKYQRDLALFPFHFSCAFRCSLLTTQSYRRVFLL